MAMTSAHSAPVPAGPWPGRTARGVVALGVSRLRAFGATEWLLLGFTASSAFSAWLSFSPEAWFRFARIALGVLIFFGLTTFHAERWLKLVLTTASFSAIGLCLFVAATNNPVPPSAKSAALTAISQTLRALLPPIQAAGLHPNVALGLLAIPLPALLATPAMLGRARREASGRRRTLLAGLFIASVAACAFALLIALLTQSRAGLAALAASLGLWAIWLGLGRLRVRRPGLILAGLTTIAYAALAAGVLWLPALLDPAAQGGLNDRGWLFSVTAPLALAAPVTGTGLASFGPVFSVYGVGIQLALLPFAHNLLVDLAIEQGIPGALLLYGAQLCAIALALRTSQRPGVSPLRRWTIQAGCAGVCVLLLHGLGDDVVYASQWVFLSFVPAGLAVAAARGAVAEHVSVPGARASGSGRRGRLRVIGLGLSGLAALGVAFERPLRATALINLGVVEQARAELGVFRLETWSNPTLDAVRRTVNLEQAIAHYEAALALQPEQRIALERLSMIALSRGDAPAAAAYAQRAWVAGHRDRTTRLVYGQAMAAIGQLEPAITAMRGLPYAAGQMRYLAFYRYQHSGDAQRAAWAHQVADALERAGPANQNLPLPTP